MLWVQQGRKNIVFFNSNLCRASRLFYDDVRSTEVD